VRKKPRSLLRRKLLRKQQPERLRKKELLRRPLKKSSESK
jgi:hypothetical protein